MLSLRHTQWRTVYERYEGDFGFGAGLGPARMSCKWPLALACMDFGNAVAGASFCAGSLLHSSGWGTVNRMGFPAIAVVLVPLLWRVSAKSV